MGEGRESCHRGEDLRELSAHGLSCGSIRVRRDGRHPARLTHALADLPLSSGYAARGSRIDLPPAAGWGGGHGPGNGSVSCRHRAGVPLAVHRCRGRTASFGPVAACEAGRGDHAVSAPPALPTAVQRNAPRVALGLWEFLVSAAAACPVDVFETFPMYRGRRGRNTRRQGWGGCVPRHIQQHGRIAIQRPEPLYGERTALNTGARHSGKHSIDKSPGVPSTPYA